MKNPRHQIIQNLHKFGLYKIVHKTYYTCVYTFWKIYGGLTGRNKKFLEQYNAQNRVRKLHMGCGTNYLNGWLNTDLYPNAKRISLNVAQGFPFEDNTFDFAFTEHVIEHMPYLCGQNMLKEC